MLITILVIKRVGPMNVQAKKLALIQRQSTLYDEVVAIQNEVDILRALQKRAEEELLDIETKLEEIEEHDNLVYIS